MNVVIETHAEFCRGLCQRHEGVPRLGSLTGARPEAHIPFAHSCTRSQFGRIVVQGDLGVRKHHEEATFLGPCLRNALVQGLIPRDGRKQRIELMHMIKKRQLVVEEGNEGRTAAEQFYALAA